LGKFPYLLIAREATDHLSQTQISDVSSAVTHASTQGGSSAFTTLQNLMGQIPGHQGRELSREMSDIQSNANAQRSYNERAGISNLSQAGEFDPEEIARQIYPILAFRDRVVKAISNTIEKVFIPVVGY
jgi:hypothetical protein